MSPSQPEPVFLRQPGGSSGSGKKWLLVIVLLAALAILAFVYKDNFMPRSGDLGQTPTPNQTEEIDFDSIMDSIAFSLVPNARETISLPPPPDSDAEDLAYYQSIQSRLTADVRSSAGDDTMDQLQLGVGTYQEWVFGGLIANPAPVIQMQQEVVKLTILAHQNYNRATPSERFSEVEAVVSRPEIDTVYPNLRAVGGFFAGELLSRVDAANADTYRTAGSAFAERGILYGLYSKSDLDASRSLVEQYFAGLESNPEYEAIMASLHTRIVNPEELEEAADDLESEDESLPVE